MITTIFVLNILLPSATSFAALPCPSIEPKDKPYDVMDGKGISKADVMLGGPNQDLLELRVTPKGRLQSLGAMFDEDIEPKKVLVLRYCYKGVGYRMIRRAAITQKLEKGFSIVQDPASKGDDHFVFTNTPETYLNQGWTIYPLGPKPEKKYPDHSELDPENKTKAAADEIENEEISEEIDQIPSSLPANQLPKNKKSQKPTDAPKQGEPAKISPMEEGTLKPFQFK